MKIRWPCGEISGKVGIFCGGVDILVSKYEDLIAKLRNYLLSTKIWSPSGEICF